MDLTITIPAPVLAPGESFKVRYRVHPAGSWTILANKTNSPFTVTGLAAGQYDFEFTLVKTSGSPPVETECSPVIKTFTVVEEVDCLEASAEIIKEGDVYFMVVSCTGPHTACFYKVKYGPGGSNTVPWCL